MNLKHGQHDQEHEEAVFLYALQALRPSEIPKVEAQIAGCVYCQQEMAAIRPIIGSFVSWPTDVLRPPTSLWDKVAKRIAEETGEPPVLPPPSQTDVEPQWEEAIPGISVKILATDNESNRVSMLVRLAPGADYPPHRHTGLEELYLLQGELMIDEKKLYPGDYSRARAGSVDHRVWSETGCTCLLLTSTADEII
jgi:anti-sigma factor ChrR (cupin superfamily)